MFYVFIFVLFFGLYRRRRHYFNEKKQELSLDRTRPGPRLNKKVIG